MSTGTRTALTARAPATRRGTRGSTARHRRVTSLDSARGLLLVVNIAAISVLAPVPDQLRHARWDGVTAIDLIFPLFVTFSGVGMAFAYRNKVPWRRTLRRSALLLLVGLAYTMAMTGTYDLSELRLTGPLQIYALLVLVIGVLHLWVRTPRAWAVVTVALASVHAAFLATWQAGCPGGDLLPTCNPSRVVDEAVLGVAHLYTQGEAGHDPEGLVAALGALVTISVGTTAGHLALRHRGSWPAPARIAVWGTTVMVLALAAATLLPAMKRLWTTPFALGVAALGVVVFAVGIAVMDLPSVKAWERVRDPISWPLVALGRNSLLVYFGSHLVLHVLHDRGGETSWAEQLATRLGWIVNERVGFVVVMVLAWVAVTAVLHRRRIYLRP